MLDSLNEVYTVRGKALWAKVHEPQISQNYPENGPMFGITLEIASKDDDSAKLLKKLLTKFKIKKALGNVVDRDGNETDAVKFTFDRKPFFDDEEKCQNYPLVVDKFANPISKDTLIGNGSDVIVSFMVREYHNKMSGKTGYSLRFTGVQVVNLVKFESKSKEKNVFKPLESFEDKLGKPLKSEDDIPF